LVKIYIDAGHGGKDDGSSGFGLHEKNLTLEICKEIETQLKANYKNIEILSTRETDIFVSLSDRTNKANKWGADIFLAVHINSATTPSPRGFESHIYSSPEPKEIAFQNVMHGEVMKQISKYNVTDRGKKHSNFHVLRESKMTSILTENLFVSNIKDATLLKTAEFISNLATGHVIGLEKFLGLQKNIPPPQTNPQPISGELYQVVVGTFNSQANAQALADKLKAEGYETYINRKS
jgi:N-acetylmuramoyl-L-alanine amidase